MLKNNRRKVFDLLLVVVILLVCDVVSAAVVQGHEENSINRAIDAKGMLGSLAENLISPRFGVTSSGGSGTSQVISLNITNLLVLVLLKALIFAAGSIGAGTWKGGYGRSLDGDEAFLTEDEILLFLGYLTGSPGNNGCLQSIACQQPERAKQYASAGDVLLKTAKRLFVEPDANYNYILKELEEAANVGSTGGDCSVYTCGSDRNK